MLSSEKNFPIDSVVDISNDINVSNDISMSSAVDSMMFNSKELELSDKINISENDNDIFTEESNSLKKEISVVGSLLNQVIHINVYITCTYLYMYK